MNRQNVEPCKDLSLTADYPPAGCQKDGVEIPEGEIVKDPKNPCETCVCKGGDIVCTVDSCPWRDDCEGRYTDGVCCPSYDHCQATGVLSSLPPALLGSHSRASLCPFPHSPPPTTTPQ
ncbi:hypothetical protein E2C01_077937 [Portunus trituberculatus]|uniref:VWFC domain-containing protein n=1 Tax=Portunus trituberculatus TaxID=210409 RepID=A0A5B7ILD7_PORTR|nr:hypothetical protein [Portunus trituberculatus]